MTKVKKTNAMRILDSNKIEYRVYEYDASDSKIDGLTIAKVNGLNPDRVFKTLVTIGNSKEHYVFVIPVNRELDLKKAAKVSGEKKIEMIPMKELLSTTGYIHGGCSPVGMKKLFKTYFHATILEADYLICSGGKRGIQIESNVDDLVKVVDGKIEDLCKA